MSNTVIKGDQLMLFDSTGKALAYATSQTLTLTGNTVDVSSKDHGFWGASEVGSITWEITTENLYTDDEYDKLVDMMITAQPVTIAFAKAANYDKNGLVATGGTVESWTQDQTNYRSGKAIIKSLTLNANTGENATYSATFTGAGALTKGAGA